MPHRVASFFGSMAKAIPVLLLKAGAFLLLLFTLGLFAGYYIAWAGISPTIFLIPLIAMVVMWYKLDEGVFVLVLLTLLVVFFPEAFSSIIHFLLG